MISPEKFGLMEMYKFYKSKFTLQERKSKGFIDNKTHNSILKDFNKELAQMIIKESLEFTLPLRLGFIRIRKYKHKLRMLPDGSIDKSKLGIDWKSTKDLWAKEYMGKTKEEIKAIPGKPVVYYLNEHTDGYRYLLYWSKKGSNAINRKVYSIRFTRENDRLLAKVLKTDPNINYYY